VNLLTPLFLLEALVTLYQTAWRHAAEESNNRQTFSFISV
jgi:hypothetical protein